MHLAGRGKNFVTARAMRSPACSINASAVIPRAKAASSAVRICAGVMMGECKLFVSVRLFFRLLRLAGRTLFLAAGALLFARWPLGTRRRLLLTAAMGWLPLRFRSNKVVVVGRSKR